MADLTTTDPIAESIAWLQGHQRILDEFGGPEHVSGAVEAPWPHLVVSPTSDGDLGELRWRMVEAVTLEVWGDPRGTTGNARCRRLALIAAYALADIVNRPAAPGLAVVSFAVPTGVAVRTPQRNGQHRYTLGMRLTLHPARD